MKYKLGPPTSGSCVFLATRDNKDSYIDLWHPNVKVAWNRSIRGWSQDPADFEDPIESLCPDKFKEAFGFLPPYGEKGKVKIKITVSLLPEKTRSKENGQKVC